MTKVCKWLIPLVLFLGCGGKPAPKPPVPIGPPVCPPGMVLNPSEEAGPGCVPAPPEAPATPRPPKPEPTKEPAPIPPEVPKDRLTICHVYDRTEEGDRVWLQLTLPTARAEWHLREHKSKEPGKGDYAGKCKEREPGKPEARGLSARPNVVVITADDLSLSTLNDGISSGWMPNLKGGIIDQGVTFANSFVAGSVCCPSRATFLTGQQTHNHGVLNNDFLSGGGVTKLNDTSTLATWLAAAGYRNGIVGKYLNGYGSNQSPSPADDQTYVAPGWARWNVSLSGKMFNYSMNHDGTIVTYGSQPADYATDVLAQRAGVFIDEGEANDAQPFFLWVTTGAPHANAGSMCQLNYQVAGPYTPAQRHLGLAAALALPQPPSFNEQNVGDKPAWLRTNYPHLTSSHITCLAQMHRGRVETMMAVDDLIGTVVARLTADGELADTVLVFTSDNGFLLGEHRVNGKQSAYEEAIRAPLYVKGPGVVGPATAQQMVVNVDLAPTVLELAQASAGLAQDGRSLVPILQDPALGAWRGHFLVEHDQVNGSPLIDYAAVRSAGTLWVEYTGGEKELYDLATDPYELTSQHSNPAYEQVKLSLRQVLNTLKACAGSGCWL